MGNNKSSAWKHAIFIGIITFFMAIFLSVFSEIVLEKFQNILFAIMLLLFIVFIGIVFDMVGVAVTAACEEPFHAKAAKKLAGSKQTLRLIANADKVANICNDVVGDICGTVSGALGAAIVFEITTNNNLDAAESILSLIITGLLAALTVGGKAVGKTIAIEQAEEVIFLVGQIFAKVEKLTGLTILKKKRRLREKV